METQVALKIIMSAAERAMLPKQDHLAVEQAYQELLKNLTKQVEAKPEDGVEVGTN